MGVDTGGSARDDAAALAPPRPDAGDLDHAIVVSALRVRRGGQLVLDQLDLKLSSRRVVGLLGPSGSGKTTLMRCLVGVQRVEAGDVLVLGLPAGAPALRSRVAYVTQAPSVYGDLSVEENLRFFARVLGARRERVNEVIATVGLGEQVRRVVGRLSGGQRARVQLASALLGQPEILILDEPTVGLDPVLREELWATFRRLADAGATLVVSSHVMDEAAHCDELLLMRAGCILTHEPPGELCARTASADVGQAFLRVIRASEPAA